MYDVYDVYEAVAAADITRLKAICEWAAESTPSRTAVIQALFRVLGAAQDPCCCTAKRQMTPRDVDVITTITPFYRRLAPALYGLMNGPPNLVAITVTTIIRLGISTDCDRAALVALAKWSFRNENNLFCSWQDMVVHDVLEHPLLFPCSLMQSASVVRRQNGSVCEEDDRCFPALMWWKLQLKQLVFFLEENYVAGDTCQVLLSKFDSLAKELARSPHYVGSPKTTGVIINLLRHAFVAACCKWSVLRGAWIAAVVASGVLKENF